MSRTLDTLHTPKRTKKPKTGDHGNTRAVADNHIINRDDRTDGPVESCGAKLKMPVLQSTKRRFLAKCVKEAKLQRTK